jgi:hypothetical protein
MRLMPLERERAALMAEAIAVCSTGVREMEKGPSGGRC